MPQDRPTRRRVLKGVAGTGAVTLASIGSSAGAEVDGIAIGIRTANDPVHAGEELEVAARLENAADEAVTETVAFVVGHDPTRVDAETVHLEPGETETIALAFETARVRNDQQFPVRVVGETDAATRPVLVYGTEGGPRGTLSVRIRDANDPVHAGEELEVVAAVGTEDDAAGAVALVVGHDPTRVESRGVSLDPGETETVTMTFETAIVSRSQEFPVRVETDSDAAERTVLVHGTEDGPDPIAVSIVETNDPVDAGEVLEAAVEVENLGDERRSREIAFVVGHDPTDVDSERVRLDPGETDTITLEFETATVEKTQEFPIRARSDRNESVRTVTVRGTDEADEPDEFSVSFPSCTRAEVRVESLADGETVGASTGFYDEGGDGDPLFGNTILEDRIEAGSDVDAPFAGTIVFEVGDERGVSVDGDTATVVVPDYGDFGTVITGITDPEGYPTATITHPNPDAESCLAAIEDNVADGGSESAGTEPADDG